MEDIIRTKLLTVVSLSFVEYLKRCSSPSICDFRFCSSGSFLRCLLRSFNSTKKLSRLRFSPSTCFSSHRLALAFISLYAKNKNDNEIPKLLSKSVVRIL